MGYLRLCILVGIDSSYPKSHYTSCLDLRFKSYGILKISATLRAGSHPLSMQQFLPKTAQNCPKLPKTAQIWLKTKLWNTTKNVEEALEHVSTVRMFNPRIFHMQFLLSKNGLCMQISAYPLVEIDDFLKVPHLVWVWDFVGMYLTHLETIIWGPTIHNYSKNRFFWTPKDCCPPFAGAKKTFSSTLNVLISQMVRNESVIFGRHIDIEVRYKILQLEVPK
jgi:hypothetical protein